MVSGTATAPQNGRPDHPLRTVGSAFWSTLKRLTILAVGLNLFWVGLFLFLGSMPLVVLSFFSALTYCVCYRLILLRKNRAVLTIFWVEVIAHVVLGTLLLGWESACHLFLFLCIPGVLASSAKSRARAQILAVVGLFFVLDIVTTIYGPWAPLPLGSTKLVAWLNYLIVFSIFCSLTAHYRGMVDRAEKRLLDTAMTDSLTGISNRTHFNSRASAEVAHARRSGQPMCLLLVDIDHFKHVNDRFGHEAGDTVLRHVADTMRYTLREIDVLARWGGEEFLILLPSSGIEQAEQTAKRLLDAVANTPVLVDEHQIAVTLSAGVVSMSPDDALNLSVSRADKALYASKANGRNRVTVSTR